MDRREEKGLLLAGDVGGTKTDLAIFSPDRGPRAPLTRKEFRTGAYPSLATMVREFLAATGVTVERATFDVAGPVLEGRAKLTNLTWVLDQTDLARELGLASVRLLNDLHAVALAVPTLDADDLHRLNEGRRDPRGAIAVIAPGTGLGEAFLTWDGSRYRSYPSEGGHGGFAPESPLEIDLLSHLMSRFGHVSRERVCSGLGIPNLYEFLRDRGEVAESPEIAAALAVAPDRTPLICKAGLRRSPPDPLCRATVDLFVAILAAEAGNLTLQVLATGGLYLAGGIPFQILPALEEGFMAQFVRKGRLGPLVSRVPVQVVQCRAALIGAAIRGFEPADAGDPPD